MDVKCNIFFSLSQSSFFYYSFKKVVNVSMYTRFIFYCIITVFLLSGKKWQERTNVNSRILTTIHKQTAEVKKNYTYVCNENSLAENSTAEKFELTWIPYFVSISLCLSSPPVLLRRYFTVFCSSVSSMMESFLDIEIAFVFKIYRAHSPQFAKSRLREPRSLDGLYAKLWWNVCLCEIRRESCFCRSQIFHCSSFMLSTRCWTRRAHTRTLGNCIYSAVHLRIASKRTAEMNATK